MILEALLDLRERIDERGGDAVPPAHSKTQRVRWFLEVGDSGEFLGLVETGAAKKEWIQVVAPYARRAGTRPPPYLVIDKPDYVLGLDVDGRHSERSSLRHDDYVALIRDCAAELSQPGLDRFLTFLENHVDGAREEAARRGVAASDLLAPRVAGVNLATVPEIRQYWARLQDELEATKSGMTSGCLACGKTGPIARTHPVELLVGPDRVSLVSGNQDAFLSYGLEQSEIAPLCHACARHYGEALRFLLAEERHRLRTAGTTWLFWTREPSDLDVLSLIREADEDAVSRLFTSVQRGQATELEMNDFYALGVTANKSRLVVRSWLTVTLDEVARNLSRYFADQRMSFRGEQRCFGLWSLVASTVRDLKDLPPRTPLVLLERAVLGRRLPLEILQPVLQRARVDPLDLHAAPRAALIKLVLLSHHPERVEGIVDSELRADHPSPAYQCGRLLAILDDIQRRAVGAKATIVDRFYGSASATPASVFGVLLRGSQSHLGKLRKTQPGLHGFFEKELGSIMGRLDPERGFPRTLSIEDQGLFALGFYQQKFSRKSRKEGNPKVRGTESSTEESSLEG